MSDENNTQLSKILEGAILAAGEPLSVVKLQTLFDEDGMPEKDEIEAALAEIKASCEARGFDLVEVASGWRFQVREDLAQWVNRLWEEKPQKYSRALLETMALIAYRQPLTRGDIEEVRGVAVSSHIIKTLTERGWVKVVGHRDVPGRPALYATTKSFLDYFNLKSLDELPSLGELKDIESLNQDLEFGILESAAAPFDHSEDDKDVMETEEVFEGEGQDAADADPEAESSPGAVDMPDKVEEEAGTMHEASDGSPDDGAMMSVDLFSDEPEGQGEPDSSEGLKESEESEESDAAEAQGEQNDEEEPEGLIEQKEQEEQEVLDEQQEQTDDNHSPTEDTERLND